MSYLDLAPVAAGLAVAAAGYGLASLAARKAFKPDREIPKAASDELRVIIEGYARSVDEVVRAHSRAMKLYDIVSKPASTSEPKRKAERPASKPYRVTALEAHPGSRREIH